jgi:hypothetical protein
MESFFFSWHDASDFDSRDAVTGCLWRPNPIRRLAATVSNGADCEVTDDDGALRLRAAGACGTDRQAPFSIFSVAGCSFVPWGHVVMG